MATQIAPAHPHNYEDETNRGVVHSVEEEDHHEKKSVFSKVKDKANKIKHTFAKKTHVSDSDHDDHRDPAYEVHSTVIHEDDDDEDSEDEPAVHGSPKYDSATAHDRTGREEIPDESSVDLGKVRPSQGDKEHVPKDPTTLEAGPHAPTDYPTRPSEGPQHIPRDGPPSEEDPTTLEAGPHAPTDYPTRPSEGPQRIPRDEPPSEEDLTTLQAGPHAPTDYPTRPSEGPPHIPRDEPPSGEDPTTLQAGPAPTDYPTRPSEGHIPMDGPPSEEDPTTIEAGPRAPTDYPTRPSELPQHIPIDGPPSEEEPTTLEAGPHAPTDYPTRPSEEPQHIPMDGSPFEEDPPAPKERPTSPANYQTEVADPTASGGNEAGVTHLDRSFQAMNLSDKTNPPTGSPDQFSPESPSEKAPIIQENLHPVPDSNNESQPSKDQPHASSYTEKISSATSALAQGAVSAKNAVASKLGYGQTGSATSAPSSGGTEYGRMIAEKLAPVYGKVADAGSAVVSKIQGSGNRSESPESEVKVTETESGVKRSDTGVPSSEFVAEKLRPGDEHKSSSEMIGDAIQKKREEPESGSVQPPAAERVSVSGGDGAGKGVVERVRGAVGSVFGMGGRPRDTPAPDSQSRDGDEGEDRKNQVSGT